MSDGDTQITQHNDLASVFDNGRFALAHDLPSDSADSGAAPSGSLKVEESEGVPGDTQTLASSMGQDDLLF